MQREAHALHVLRVLEKAHDHGHATTDSGRDTDLLRQQERLALGNMAQASAQSHMQTLITYRLGLNQNYYTFALI